VFMSQMLVVHECMFVIYIPNTRVRHIRNTYVMNKSGIFVTHESDIFVTQIFVTQKGMYS